MRIVQRPSKNEAVDSVGTRSCWSAGAADTPVAACTGCQLLTSTQSKILALGASPSSTSETTGASPGWPMTAIPLERNEKIAVCASASAVSIAKWMSHR